MHKCLVILKGNGFFQLIIKFYNFIHIFRDRTPFVLTSDMAFVINGGDRPTPRFHYFVDLCCKAFNIIRNNGDLILHMFALMATSGIPGVTGDGQLEILY